MILIIKTYFFYSDLSVLAIKPIGYEHCDFYYHNKFFFNTDLIGIVINVNITLKMAITISVWLTYYTCENFSLLHVRFNKYNA